ncbi:MAG: hypothetical protein ABIJ45_11690 [Candidatus Zixiibacteriota bacterium]
MLKHYRIAFIAVMFILLGASLLSAQTPDKNEKSIWPTYYSLTDPGNTPPGSAPWQAIIGNIIIPASSDIWFGTENVYVPTNTKYYELILVGAQVGSLINPVATAFDNSGVATITIYGPYTSTVNDDLVIKAIFKPQPAWEVIKLTNSLAQAVTLTEVTGSSQCVGSTPTLTYVGIGILILLLALSTIWIWRKKRTGVPA